MIIHKTIFRDLIKNLVVVVLSMSVLLFMEQFVRTTRVFMGKSVEFIDILKLFVYFQPSVLMLSVPMAILIATFLTYGRMNADSEIVVLKASGMSFPSISRSSFILAGICFIAVLFVSVYLMPRGMYAFKRTLHESIAKKASMSFDESSFSDMFKGTVIFVNEKVSENEYKGVFVFRDSEEPFGDPFVIVAHEGRIISDPEEGVMKLNMENGLIHSYKDERSSEIAFSKYGLVLTSGIESITASRPEEIETSLLWANKKGKLSWTIELHRRFALPFACLIFGILGPALSFRIGKIGRLGGFSLSLTILTLYYVVLLLGKGLADVGKISPFMGGWSANILFGLITGIFFYLSYKDSPVGRLKV